MASKRQTVERKFRWMIDRLSGRLLQTNCKRIIYLNSLSPSEASSIEDMPLYVLSSLESNGYINPLDVDYLESTLREIDRHDLLPIVTDYKESREYKDALKERKKKGKKKKRAHEDSVNVQDNDCELRKMSNRKKRLRDLYTLLIMHTTAQTKVMEILQEELEGEEDGGEKVNQAVERFLKDGGDFMDNLHKTFWDMGIKPNNRDSTSSEDTAATPTTDTNNKLPGEAPVATSTPAKQRQRKKPVPLPRKNRIPEVSRDLDIHANLGPIKQEEGSTISLDEYHLSVRKFSMGKKSGFDDGEEEDFTENTGDSGIAEWRAHSVDDLLVAIDNEDPIYSSLQPRKKETICTSTSCHNFKARSEGNLLDANPDGHTYTTLMQRKGDNVYTTISNTSPRKKKS